MSGLGLLCAAHASHNLGAEQAGGGHSKWYLGQLEDLQVLKDGNEAVEGGLSSEVSACTPSKSLSQSEVLPTV